MQNFSIQEIQDKIDYHQKMADRFMKLFNERIKSCVLVITGESDSFLAPIAPGKAPAEELKKFLYEMSVFHVNERIKWDLAAAAGAGSEPTVGGSSKTLNH